jgi:hypothetical protein
MADYIRYAFAVSGDRATVAQTTQPSGVVSWQEGYGFDYQREQGVDPLAKDVPRDAMNQIIYAISNAAKQYQENGTPDFITTSDNGGTPFSYSKNARVRYDDGVNGFLLYQSKVDSNTSLPTDTTKWSVIGIDVSIYKTYVDVVATANLTLSGLQTIDGYVGTTDTAVLAAGQSAPAENGIYLMKSGAWVRRGDFDTSDKALPSSIIPCLRGTANQVSGWQLETVGPITLGTTALVFRKVWQKNFAPLASPDFTGVPLADTAATGTSTRQIASTEFVQNAIAGINIVTTTYSGAGTYPWTRDPKLISLNVKIQAPGGGSSGTSNAPANLAAGAGGGAEVEKNYNFADLNASETLVLGAPGVGGPATNSSTGTDGGACTFKGLTANGGKGSSNTGATPYIGGDGGTATGGDWNRQGGDGGDVQAPLSGYGGSSPNAGSARGRATQGVGRTGKNYGGGAAGSCTTGIPQVGGDGSPAYAVFTELRRA